MYLVYFLKKEKTPEDSSTSGIFGYLEGSAL